MKNITIRRINHTSIKFKGNPDPLKIFSSLKGQENGFLFESADQCGDIGRYSLIGLDPVLELTSLNSDTEIICKRIAGTETFHHEGDPFQVMKEILKPQENPATAYPFSSGGLAGWIGYDAVCHIENIERHKAQATMKDIHLMMPEHLLVFDHQEKAIEIFTFSLDENLDKTAEENIQNKREAFVERLKSILADISVEKEAYEKSMKAFEHSGGGLKQVKSPLELSEDWTAHTTKSDFINHVHTAKAHIKKGDAFQLVFSRRLTKETTVSAKALYGVLRALNPSPYMFIVHTEDVQVVGASPETMVHLKDKRATIHPIAGTRPRGLSEGQDAQNEKDLLEDIKENAEHLMLVDLARNDIGRIAKFGTVEVPKFKTIERFSHVMHIVSEVAGQVDEKMDAVDVFKACFPAGTVSGAPKVKAMSIISQNEPVRRGVYAGAVGWLGTDGNMDTCIAIRTAVLRNGQVSVQAGGGLVQDSDPEMEFMETIHKSGSIMRAVQVAEDICQSKSASTSDRSREEINVMSGGQNDTCY